MRRALGPLALLLSGCPSVPEGVGPCPCAAPLICCAPLQRCLPPDALCPVADASVARSVTISPAVGQAGDTVQIDVSPPAEIAEVRVGPGVCVPVADAPSRCLIPAYAGAQAAVDVHVTLADTATLVLPGGFRYRLPAFIEVSAAAGVRSGAGPGVVAHDLDADGRLDLVFAISGADDGAVFLQDAPWVAAPQSGLAPLTGLRVEDLDQDGAPDLLALHAAGDLVSGAPWSRRVGDAIEPAGGGEFARTEIINGVLVDLDGDGWADWVGHRQSVALDRPGWVRALFVAQGGPAGFIAQPAPFEPDPLFATGDVRRYALIDHDNDGDADVLACGDALWLFANEGGALVDRSDRLGPPIEQPCGDLVVADFDRDGAFDVAWVAALDFADAATSGAATGTWVLRNLGGTFTANTAQPAIEDPACLINRAPGSTLALGRSVIAAFDADLDGDEDLFLPTPFGVCPGPMAWYENASGRFVARPVEGPLPGVQPAAALPVDLDGDGDMDVITAAQAPGERGRLWRNLAMEDRADDADARRSLTVILDARQTARGARITLTAGGETQHRLLGTLGNADGPPEALFGLGAAPPPYVVTVRWSDGAERVVEHDAPGRLVVTP